MELTFASDSSRNLRITKDAAQRSARGRTMFD
eukprot:COSAG02_NODE_28064_length_597_cov_0.805221_1_plen_31_part_01